VSTSKKKITKLLLRGASCSNCNFRQSLVENPNQYCANRKYCPKVNCCGHWKRDFLSGILKIRRNIFPNLIAKELIQVQPVGEPSGEIFYIKPTKEKNNKITSQKL